MIFLGHIGITIFLAALLYLPISYAFLGVLLPDIVDKTLYSLGAVDCGRLIAHSIFFAPVAGAVIYFITKNKMAGLAITFGSYLHLIEDAQYFIPWLYPLVEYNNSCAPISVRFGLIELTLELIGAILLIALVLYRERIVEMRRKFWSKIIKNNRFFKKY